MLSGGLGALRLEKNGLRGKEAYLDTYGTEYEWWDTMLYTALEVIGVIQLYQECHADQERYSDIYETLKDMVRKDIQDHETRDHVEYRLRTGANNPVLWEYTKILAMVQEQEIEELNQDTSVSGLLLTNSLFCNEYCDNCE